MQILYCLKQNLINLRLHDSENILINKLNLRIYEKLNRNLFSLKIIFFNSSTKYLNHVLNFEAQSWHIIILKLNTLIMLLIYMQII